jgi:3-isopropylmalate/(R)-2-methylmalate dehydratase small subunit
MSLTIIGKVWKFGDNISTDFMAPGYAGHRGLSEREEALYCMHSNRPDWAGKVGEGDIIVAGRNFGLGSSRVEAPRNLTTLGISGVVAESVGRIFFRNCVALGLPVLICKDVRNLFEEGDMAQVDFRNGQVTNLNTLKQTKANALPEIALRTMEAGGILPLLKKEYAKKPRT